MTWSTPYTFVDNTIPTAAQMNAAVRDNLLETAPAKASTASGYFVATGPNTIVQRVVGEDSFDTPIENTFATSFSNLATPGPDITLTTGTKALVWHGSQCDNDTVGQHAIASFRVETATTIDPEDRWGVFSAANTHINAGNSALVSLTAGSNTFRHMYRVNGGEGLFAYRRITVMPL